MPRRNKIPRKTQGGTLGASPNPVQAGVSTAVVVTGSNFPNGPVNVGFRGETSWANNVGVAATATVVGGTFTVTLPSRAYVGPNPDSDPVAFPQSEMYLEARAPGVNENEMPDLIAKTILYVTR